jgi:hypothetical protein
MLLLKEHPAFFRCHGKRGNQCHKHLGGWGMCVSNRVTPSNRRPLQQGPDYEDGSRLEPPRRRALM